MSDAPSTVAEVTAMAKEYYSIPGNEAGGSLHVVLDDENCEDEYVDFCIEVAIERGDVEGERLGRILRTLSEAEREEVAAGVYR